MSADREFSEPAVVRDRLAATDSDLRPSSRHDAAILAAAAAIGNTAASAVTPFPPARPRRARSWQVPASLAAGLALGSVLSWLLLVAPASTSQTEAEVALTIPAAALSRGAAAAPVAGPVDGVPVERADPQAWYRYIEELLAAGRQREALQHLRRFNELHPDYVHQP
jgi:hypothetical protein